LPKGKATIARFSPDGLSVLTGSADGTAQLWDARSGRPTSAVFRHPEQILFVQFSPDGLQLVTASADRTAQVWDVRTGKALGRPLAHRNVVSTAQFSPDGTRLLTTADGDSTRVWNAYTGQVLSTLNESGGVLAAAFSPDGLRVVTGIKDRTASLWNAQTGERIGPPLLHGGAVVSVLFTADGLELVTASSNRRVHRWNLLTGEAVSDFPLEGRNDHNRHSALPLSPDGRQVVTTHENSARVWDTHTGEPTTDRLAHEAEVVSADFNTNGQKVVTASIDGTARVWDARSGEPLTEPLRHPRGVILAHFSPDGQRLVTVSEDGIARVWEVFSAPPPTPAWFLDWAEARVGHRAGPSTSETEISVAETLRQRASVSARIDDSFYSRVAQWSETDPETRTLSAFTTPSVKEYAQQGLLGGYRPRSRQPIVLVHFTGETQ
jgi:WD40 repeat protein